MTIRILVGDALGRLRDLPDESIQCCVTSPPYWGLRSYLPEDDPAKPLELGDEPSPREYVGRLVEVFREVRRVLRPDGTCWVNLGDCYVTTRNSGTGWDSSTLTKPAGRPRKVQVAQRASARPRKRTYDGLKLKDLVGIPWRVAFALQDDGWWLRGDHVWGKPNGMPESVTNRPVRGHEYVFMLSKSQDCWYDADAVRTAPKSSSVTRLARALRAGDAGDDGRRLVMSGSGREPPGQHPQSGVRRKKARGHVRKHEGLARADALSRAEQMADGAALRSVWWIPPAQCTEDHFAVMPDLVAEICILAGCPAGGTVLDPFGGYGTTGIVADRLQRHAVLIELGSKFAELAETRIRREVPLLADVRIEEATHG